MHVLREFAPPSTRFAVVELDSEDNVGRLTEWFTSKWSQRAAATFNRQFDALRSAAAFWASQGWLTDPTRPLRRRGRAPDRTRAIPAADIEALLSMDAPIREKTLWTMLYETAAGLLGHAMPGQQHQRPHAQARPDRDAGTYIKPMLPRPAGPRSGSAAGCRPGTTGWSAASAVTRTPARRRRRSPRSRAPCLRSPTRCS